MESSTELHFRPPGDGELARLGARSALAFPGPLDGPARGARYEALARIQPGEWFVVERGGQPVGQYRTLFFDAWFGGRPTAAVGLASVAVEPTARRTGVAAAIVRHHLRRAVERGARWSLLYPFAASYYRHFGWGPIAGRLRHRLRPGELPLSPLRHKVRLLDLDDPATLAALGAWYQRCCEKQNGSLSRPVAAVAYQHRGHLRYAVGIEGPTGMDGYLLAELRGDDPRPQTLVVEELSAVDATAERALLGFLAAQADQVDWVELDRPLDDGFALLLSRHAAPREGREMPAEHHPAATLYGGAMARLVDLDRALTDRGYRDDGVLGLALHDGELGANRGPRTLVVDHGHAEVRSLIAPETPLIRGSIAAFAQVASGALPLSAVVAAGHLELEGSPAALAKATALLALPAPYPVPIF